MPTLNALLCILPIGTPNLTTRLSNYELAKDQQLRQIGSPGCCALNSTENEDLPRAPAVGLGIPGRGSHGLIPRPWRSGREGNGPTQIKTWSASQASQTRLDVEPVLSAGGVHWNGEPLYRKGTVYSEFGLQLRVSCCLEPKCA